MFLPLPTYHVHSQYLHFDKIVFFTGGRLFYFDAVLQKICSFIFLSLFFHLSHFLFFLARQVTNYMYFFYLLFINKQVRLKKHATVNNVSARYETGVSGVNTIIKYSYTRIFVHPTDTNWLIILPYAKKGLTFV